MIRRITHDTTCKTAACESACYAPKAPPPLCLHLPLLLRWYYLLLLVPGPVVRIVNRDKPTELIAMHATLILPRGKECGGRMRPSY